MALNSPHRARYEWMADNIEDMPLERLVRTELVHCASGLPGIKGKRKAQMIQSLKWFIQVGPLSVPPIPQVMRNLDMYPAIRQWSEDGFAARGQGSDSHDDEEEAYNRRHLMDARRDYGDYDDAWEDEHFEGGTSEGDHDSSHHSQSGDPGIHIDDETRRMFRSVDPSDAPAMMADWQAYKNQQQLQHRAHAGEDEDDADDVAYRRVVTLARTAAPAGSSKRSRSRKKQRAAIPGAAAAESSHPSHHTAPQLDPPAPHGPAAATDHGTGTLPPSHRLSVSAWQHAPVRPPMSSVLESVQATQSRILSAQQGAAAAAAGAEVISGQQLRTAVAACVPSNRTILRFAYGPARASRDFRCEVPATSPAFDSLGRASKHLLVVTVLDPASGLGLSRSPAGARICINDKPVRVPGPSCCAWDVSRITIKGQRAIPASVTITHSLSGMVVVCGVVEVVCRADLSAPVLAVVNGLALPASAVLAMGRACAGSSGADAATDLQLSRCSQYVIANRSSLGNLWPVKPSQAAAAASPSSSSSSSSSTATAAPISTEHDDELTSMETELVIKLTDPVRRKPISLPVRSSECNHLDVMDAKSFEALPASSDLHGSKRCPHCRKTILQSSLVVDTALAALMAAINSGQVHGNIQDTVSAMYGMPAASLASLELKAGHMAAAFPGRNQSVVVAAPAWINAQEGVAIRFPAVQSVRLSPDGTWAVLGSRGKVITSIAEAEADAADSKLSAEDDDEADEFAEAEFALAAAKRGRASLSDRMSPQRATRVAGPVSGDDGGIVVGMVAGHRIIRRESGEEVIDLT